MKNKIKLYIPTESHQSVFDIDYIKLYDDNIRLILTDLDNTLISYKEVDPDATLIDWHSHLKAMGFEVIIVSNSPKKRVEHFAKQLGVKYVSRALKPFLRGYRKALGLATREYDKSEIVVIGDQLMTDILAGNKWKVKSFLVKAVDRKSDIFLTRINRNREKRIINKIAEHYPCDYAVKLKEYI